MEEREFPQPPAASNRWHAGLPAASQSSVVMDTVEGVRIPRRFSDLTPQQLTTPGRVLKERSVPREPHNITMGLL
jgi:hypothetical protein